MSSDQAVTGTAVQGAVALVTGGNRGLGLAVVEELLSRGAAKVYATSRSAHEHTDPRVVPLVLDVTDEASVEAAAKAAADVSIVVNNAGITLSTPVLTAPLEDISAELDANLFGLLRVSRAFAPVLAGRPPTALVNVLSVLSWISFGGGYEISKAAAWSATNALRLSLSEQGTTVTGVHVGYMDTDMTAGVNAPKLAPAVVAEQVVDAILEGSYEVLADEISHSVRAGLSQDLTVLYGQLAAA